MRPVMRVLAVTLLVLAACDGDLRRIDSDDREAQPRVAVLGTCGDGHLDPDELCDPGIAGGAGACPTTCTDIACSRDELVHGGTCFAQCRHDPITVPHDDDGCCPPGATADTDNDCPRCTCEDDCGDGDLDPGERCDTGIGAGDPGACPTACADDGIACTRDVVDQPATCQAACVHLPITEPADGDGCCPPGANATNDRDCASVCGNGIVEPGEQCDDGNDDPTDACHQCRLVPTAFRFTQLELRDPHVFAPVLCLDATSVLTNLFSSALTGDSDGDGFLDLSPTLVFRPLAQGGTSTAMSAQFARCSPPASSTRCAPGAPPVVSTVADNATGTCLGIIPGTVRPYSPPVTVPTGACFATPAQAFSFPVLGIVLPLQQAQIAAVYSGRPATGLTSGLLRGFLRESDANQIVLPSSLPIVGGRVLASLLPGGNGSCANHNGRDVLDGVSGWWLYINFQAGRVPWTE